MQFTSVFAAVAFLVAAVSASGTENPFITPEAGAILEAGKSFKVEWKPTKGDTVKLILRKGLSGNLDLVETLEAKLTNTGSYVWKIDSKLPARNDYALEIRHGDAEFDNNYTGQFSIDSDVKEEEEEETTTATKSATANASQSTLVSTATASGNLTGTTKTGSSTKPNQTEPASNEDDDSSAGRFTITSGAVLAAVIGAVAFLA